MTRYFVTATGTEIGKTFVTAYLIRQARARGLSARAIKPVLSGFEDHLTDSDAHLLLQAMGQAATPDALDRMTPWRFRAPLSPDMAAAREGRSIDKEAVIAHSRAAFAGPEDLVLTEGVGGAFVPLDRGFLVADWIKAAGVPALVVAGSYLGTISHSIATVEALRGRGVTVAALIISQSPQSPVPVAETAAVLTRELDLRVLTLPRLADRAADGPDLLSPLL